jgi:dTDP-4-dehydrorhamnose reductase
MLLVIGGSGLLGRSFLDAARRRGLRVVGTCREHRIALPDVEVATLDLEQEDAIFRLVDACQPSWIVLCAAMTDVDACERQPERATRLNTDAAGTIATTAARVGARLVYVSTDAVFDGASGGGDEGGPPAPGNAYARSKLAGERAVRAALPTSLIVRTNFYGWRGWERPTLVEWLWQQLRSGAAVPGFSDVRFNPISASDLSEILLRLIDRGLEGVYHVAGNEPCTKFEFACRFAATFGFDASLVHPAQVAGTGRAPRPHDTTLRTDRVCRALGCDMPGLEQGLRGLRALVPTADPEAKESESATAHRPTPRR